MVYVSMYKVDLIGYLLLFECRGPNINVWITASSRMQWSRISIHEIYCFTHMPDYILLLAAVSPQVWGGPCPPPNPPLSATQKIFHFLAVFGVFLSSPVRTPKCPTLSPKSHGDRGWYGEKYFFACTFFHRLVMPDRILFTELKNIALVLRYGLSKMPSLEKKC